MLVGVDFLKVMLCSQLFFGCVSFRYPSRPYSRGQGSKAVVGQVLSTGVVAIPEPGSTRLADPNRNPGMLGLFLFIFHVIKFYFSKKKSRPESPAQSE